MQKMGLPGLKVVQMALSVVALQSAVGFVLETGQSHENIAKGHLRNVSLHHLSSGYLKRLYEDLTLLKISNSKIEKIDKYAFDHLIHLNLLELSDVEIQEELDPQTFSRLPGLEILHLKNLGLRRVSLNLTHVQDLNLARNKLEIFDGGSIVGKDVDSLNLSGNKLRQLTGSFANLSKLSMIDISKNYIAEIPPVFEENVNLQKIFAAENKITSTEGLRLPWLKTLDLFVNKIVILNSESFADMKALEDLVLAFNRIRNIEDAFKDLLELKYLNLAWNSIEELSPDLFRNNLYLTRLSLQGNRIKSLQKFRSFHEPLTHLDLSHNQLALLDDEFFSAIPNLQILDLSFNRLKAITNVLAPLTGLKVLNLAFNNISMTGYELWANQHLLRVNLSSNALQGGLTHFKNNRHLNTLDVSENKISNFCDGRVELKNLLKVSVKGNLIKNLTCLKGFKSLCEVDLRNNPLICGEELDDLILNLARMKGSPYRLMPEFQADVMKIECEDLSLNRSLKLWNSVRRELCPEVRDLAEENKAKTEEWESTEEDDATEEVSESADVSDRKEKTSFPKAANPRKGPFIVQPIGWIGNDEMNKPNPMQKAQSERTSWEAIEKNAEMLNGFEEEDIAKTTRFSWYTIALILIGLSLTLTCFNLVVFLYIRMKVWKRSDTNSQKYTVLHSEVYRNTTEPTNRGEWSSGTQTKNKIFTFGRLDEILLNFSLGKKDKDSESVRNILIAPTNHAQN